MKQVVITHRGNDYIKLHKSIANNFSKIEGLQKFSILKSYCISLHHQDSSNNKEKPFKTANKIISDIDVDLTKDVQEP